MNIQSETVRKYVLDHLENGYFSPESRLPGSRKISETLGISRPVVQNALDILVNEGVLCAVSRSGLYVNKSWTFRRIRNSIRLYTGDEFLPWVKKFRNYVQKELPELHITRCCDEGDWEIVTTAVAQSRFREFADIKPVLDKCYPDLSPFYAEQLKPFMQQERLTALPILFSPRIIACSRRMLKEAGCPVPSLNWSVEEFSALTERLRKHFPAEQIFPWNTNYYCWMNFILSFGGKLFSLDNTDPVCFDSPETIAALEFFRSLRGKKTFSSSESIFNCGQFAFSVVDRQICSLNRRQLDDDFLFLPIPGTSAACTGCSIQATELLVMRKGCVDNGLCARLISYLWSKEFQDHLAELHYGIPVLKSAGAASDEFVSEADPAFETVLSKLNNDYNLSSPELFKLVSCGISSILDGEKNIRKEIGELANTVRNYLKYTQQNF